MKPETERSGHPRFYELLEAMAELHSRKNQDYSGGPNGHPMRNLMRCADAGIPPWKGVIVRLCDKFDRLLTFAELETYAVTDEKVTDTFLDMAIYSLLGLILYEEQDHPAEIERERNEWVDAALEEREKLNRDAKDTLQSGGGLPVWDPLKPFKGLGDAVFAPKDKP